MPKTVSKASSSSRGSYQKGYQLGNKGGAAPKGSGPMAASVKGEGPPKAGSGRSGGRQKKLGGDAEGGGDINVSYGSTLPITDLETVADFSKGAKAGKALKLGKAVDYGKEKGDSGSGFNYRKRR
jgi:hypothetical protein